MNYYVFDSEIEATTAQSLDYNDYVNSLPTEKDDGEGGTIAVDNTKYLAVTVRWCEPKQRQTDNKYVYVFCPASTAVGRTIEEINTGGNWFELE